MLAVVTEEVSETAFRVRAVRVRVAEGVDVVPKYVNSEPKV